MNIDLRRFLYIMAISRQKEDWAMISSTIIELLQGFIRQHFFIPVYGLLGDLYNVMVTIANLRPKALIVNIIHQTNVCLMYSTGSTALNGVR